MKTKFIITSEDLDNLDEFETINIMGTFASEQKARAEFKSWVNGRTNCHVRLLRVELLDNAEGRLK